MDHLADISPAAIGEEEAKLRKQLADFYHLIYFMGWAELIFNHVSMRLPGDSGEYLVNPFGLHYTEITPDNLITVSVDGKLTRPSPYPANPAGFALHGVIHQNRPDLHCIVHHHSTAVSAVGVKTEGFKHNNFYSAQLYGRIGYHAFEGVTIYDDERERMLASLGNKHILMLRNHGVAVCERDIPTTFMLLQTVQRAAEVQCQASAMAGEEIALDQAIVDKCVEAADFLNENAAYATLAFDGMVRLMRKTIPASW
jgi:ribulose-5-phosphate 4-epimerase/fuculose-1-phosphate aldolase